MDRDSTVHGNRGTESIYRCNTCGSANFQSFAEYKEHLRSMAHIDNVIQAIASAPGVGKNVDAQEPSVRHNRSPLSQGAPELAPAGAGHGSDGEHLGSIEGSSFVPDPPVRAGDLTRNEIRVEDETDGDHKASDDKEREDTESTTHENQPENEKGEEHGKDILEEERDGDKTSENHMDGDLPSNNVTPVEPEEKVPPCYVCGVEFSGPKPYLQHMRSGQHEKQLKKKEFEYKLKEELEQSSHPIVTIEGGGGYHCKMCRKKFSEAQAALLHLTGQKHVRVRERLKLVEEILKDIELNGTGPRDNPSTANDQNLTGVD